MAIRKDGIESSEKLLKAAMAVFAEKGYRKATVAQICRKAGSNVAAVNYHFKSKDGLYAQVWKNSFAQAIKAYPPDGNLGPDADAQKKLRVFIRSTLHRILDSGKIGYAGQILLREMAQPSGAIEQILHDVIRPLRHRTYGIIAELLGSEADRQDVKFCMLSIVNQCMAIGFMKSRKKLPPILGTNEISEEFIDDLAEHITTFSLAGIEAVKKKNKLKKRK